MNVYQSRMPLLAPFEHLLHRTMTIVLANSKRVFRQLHEDESVPERKLRLIYNGVDLTRFLPRGEVSQVRQKMRVEDDALVMTIVANLIAYKGHADLLDALILANSQLPAGWRLLVVGRDDGIGALLQAKATEYGLSGNVLFLGSRDDIPDLLHASDIGILCSHQEGFSNAILEGMAAGLPMIVTDVGGNSEAVIDGQTGIVVPAHAPDRLATAILSLAGNTQLRESLGAAGRKRVEQEFSNSRCIEQYRDLYNSHWTKAVPLP